jgi:hypothetical protein
MKCVVPFARSLDVTSRRRSSRSTGVARDAPSTRGPIDEVLRKALALLTAERTPLSSDLIFNLASHPSGLTRAVAFLIGHRNPGPTLLERVMVKDRHAAGDQIGRIVAWEVERIVLAHGNVIASNGSAVVRNGYRWLQPRDV